MISEIKKNLQSLNTNLNILVIIITLIFILRKIIGLIIIHPIIEFICTNLIGLVNFWLSLAIIYIIYKNSMGEKIGLFAVNKKILSDFKQFLIIFVIQFIILFLSLLFIIPILPFVIVQALLIFVWQVFIVEDKQNFEVFLISSKIVIENLSFLIKYLIIYLVVYALVFIISFVSNFQMMFFEKSILIIFQYIGQLTLSYFTVLFTKLYLQINDKNEQLSDFS